MENAYYLYVKFQFLAVCAPKQKYLVVICEKMWMKWQTVGSKSDLGLYRLLGCLDLSISIHRILMGIN